MDLPVAFNRTAKLNGKSPFESVGCGSHAMRLTQSKMFKTYNANGIEKQKLEQCQTHAQNAREMHDMIHQPMQAQPLNT